ncbi:MAG TPA: PPOX class F420-dependent oxidoreductase [Herpetosiphonaceae bacterium]|nr:PPOX class F420-dependent oxidoreductase [Herpetosiphonaceae bacterium]
MATIPESHRDLLETDTAMLATLGPDGFPQVTATWFLLDDGTVKLSLNTSRQKVKNLDKNPECTFFVLDRANPYRTLEIRARAAISPDVDYAVADKVGKKYGMDVRAMDQPGQYRVVVSLTPVKVNTYGA